MPGRRTTRYGGSDKAKSVFDVRESPDGNYEAKTLDDLFELQKKGEKELSALRVKMNKQAADSQSQYLRGKMEQVERNLADAKMAGVKDLASYEEKLRKDAIKEEREKRLAVQAELHADELKKAKDRSKHIAQRVKDGKEDNAKQREENNEVLRFYKLLEESGKGLTEDQRADKEEREQQKEKLASDAVALEFQDKMISSLKNASKAIQGLADSVSATMDTVTSLQAHTNARLQGNLEEDTFSSLSDTLLDAIGITPYFSNETMLSNLSEMINEGIVSNVEQRAFIQTAKENIANTFDAANSSLLRIIRMQQSDSTAARLGMEAYLTRYLNGLVDNTEYLNSTFDSVTDALVEAQSHMSTEMGAELEYVVQKWLGALTGVGMSESTASSIAQALGYLGSGNIDALSSSDLQNLLVMAASKSGSVSYSSILENGLTAEDADALMKGLVEYLAEVDSSGSNVVKSQLASTFGVSYSDLTAAKNLSGSISDIYGNAMSYSGMYDELSYQLDQISGRLTMAQMFDTVFDNLEFNLGEEIASNPALAAVYKVTELIGENTGGINIPYISAFGSGIDLNTTVDNLVKLGVVGVSTFGLIGDAITGIQNSMNTSGLLNTLGISKGATTISRGTGLASGMSGLSQSMSMTTTVGNASGEDIKASALASATDEAESNAAVDDSAVEREEAPLNTYNYLTQQFDSTFKEMLTCIKESNAGIYSYLKDTLDSSLTKLASDVTGIKDGVSSMGEKVAAVADIGDDVRSISSKAADVKDDVASIKGSIAASGGGIYGL